MRADAGRGNVNLGGRSSCPTWNQTWLAANVGRYMSRPDESNSSLLVVPKKAGLAGSSQLPEKPRLNSQKPKQGEERATMELYFPGYIVVGISGLDNQLLIKIPHLIG